MTLAILNLSGLDEAGWRPWFEAVLPAGTRWQVAADPDDLPAADRYLLIYDAPDAQFLRAMRDGVAFEQIIADWTEHARQVLARWRKARRRFYLIDADAFAAAPALLAESLGGWLGCEMGPPPAADAKTDAQPLAILAAQAAHCLAPVRQLADELEIGGLSPRLAGQGSAPRLSAAYAALQAQARAADKNTVRSKQLDKAKAKTAAAQADRAKARHAVQALTLKLEQAIAETHRLEAALKAEKETANLAAQAAQALFHEEIDLLQQQLTTVQQAMEQEYRDGQALRQEAGSDRHQMRSDLDRMRAAAELEQLRLSTMLQEQAEQMAALLEAQRMLTTERDRSREEVDALLASTSWRVTAPLRRARLAVAKPT